MDGKYDVPSELAGMNTFKDGWFTEIDNVSPHQALSMAVEEVLYHKRSTYQDILVFKSKVFGRVLVLDDAVQCTEKDEFSYQEMIAFLPLNCHPCPKKVLIIGGGDGGVVREVVKHPSVESVTLCEIDQKVIEVSQKYLPFMTEGINNPKVNLHIGDGYEFVKNHREEFDVIITDSSDPKGPALCLFQKPYYEALKQALKPGGIVCSQGESIWFTLDLIRSLMDICRSLYPVVEYATCYVPTYPGGQIGFLLCSMSEKTFFREPKIKFTHEQLKELKLKYYTPAIHRSSFCLPLFAEEELQISSS